MASWGSLLEASWRVLKHNWLLLHQIDSDAGVSRLAEFDLGEHDTALPHSAFEGQTPDDMYLETGDRAPDRLAEARTAAREARMEKDRAQRCAVYA